MAEELHKPTSLNVEQAVNSLMDQLTEQPEEVEAEDQDEIEEQEEVETAEETEEVEDDQPEEDDADEASSETEDDDDLYVEIDGEEVSLAQLREWRSGGMKSKDYTRKTQELSEARREVESTRIATQQELKALQDERAQLQEAFASLAIDAEKEPNWVELAGKLTPQDYQKRQADWQQKQARKQQARQAHQALQAQHHSQIAQREMAALLHHKPEWADPARQEQVRGEMQAVGKKFGLTPDEIDGITDHRMFLVLDRLAHLEAQAAETEKAKDVVSKRVVKAAPRRNPKAQSPKEKPTSKALKAKNARFAKTRSVNDATDAIMAELNNS